MQASAEIFFEHERWGRNLAWSAGLHVAVVGAIILYAAFASGGRGQGWGSGGGGDFGTRFGWYVDTVRRKVSDNWLKYEIDPRIGEARRVYLVFDITRDGHPSHIEVEQSSGVPSLDQSAVRALQRIDTFGPLPSDYSGNKVSVEFWFDYKR